MKKPLPTLVLLVLCFIGIKAYCNDNVSARISENITLKKVISGYILNGNAGVYEDSQQPPEIASFSPSTAAQGDTVTIIGTNFTGATSVGFGSTPAASVTVTSPTTILATVGRRGTGYITVSTPYGTAYFSKAKFTMIPPPSFEGDWYLPGGRYTRIGLFGQNIAGATHAYIGGVEVNILDYFPLERELIIGGNIANGGLITVTTPGGTASAGYFTFVPEPTITSFSPATAKPGDIVTITGTDFTLVSEVLFGGVQPAPYSLNRISPTSLSAKIGPLGATGKITVQTVGGKAASATDLTFLSGATFASFSPATAKQGDIVTITGTNFTSATNVVFGGVPAASFKVTSPTSITATVGAGAGGKVMVLVGGNELYSTTDLTYLPPPEITSFSPAKAAQGDVVTITGANFTGATNITFGGVPAAAFAVVSPTSISATVGPGASGKITITNPGGTTPSTTDFTFIPPPAITSFTPVAAAQGATVTISGFNFKNVTGVSFGGVPSTTFKALSATLITAIIPNTAISGNIEVTTTGGKATVSGFTFLPKPVVFYFYPTRAASGDTITITGINFNDVTAVKFNNNVPARSFKVVSSTSIIATVGAGASGNVNVITTGGAGSQTGFFYILPPTVTSFSPATATQGDVVTITGTNFADVTAVNIGGVATTSFTRLSPTSITARVGPGASGNITVTSPAGTTTSATGFTFLPPPAITSFTPAKAGQGQVIAITGINFYNVTKVLFGNVPARSFTVVSPTSIMATVGSGARGNVTIKTKDGGTFYKPGFAYYNIEPPTITSYFQLQPEHPVGWDVFIDGNNFTDVTSVKFGGVPGPFTILSDTLIRAQDIWGESGKITVTSPAGTGTSATDFISRNAGVRITYFTPAKAAQGDVVTIFGGNFNGVTNVTFGGVPAASFTVTSANSILATVGAGGSGNIIVTKPGFTDYEGPFTFVPTLANKSFNLAATGVKKEDAKEKQTNILEDIISYPNPFTNSITLKLGDKVFKNLKVEVLNYFGKVLYSKEFVNQAGEVSLDLSNQEGSQLYVLKLSADNIQYITKIAKK